MERVRESLLRKREELVDRWDRQLRAASDAGFALDGETARNLPLLLDAAVARLNRRFVPASAEAPSADSAARRAGLHWALLGEFVVDTVLEAEPSFDAAEQRRLADSVAQAAVEVLVREAVEREAQRQRRGVQRLASVAHALRDSMTAALLSMDLLRRQGALGSSRAARSLISSMTALRAQVEDAELTEVLTAGGFRFSRVRLAPVLAGAAQAAETLGARSKNVVVELELPAKPVTARADPRVVRPAVRGLIRAAVELAREGGVIRVGAEAAPSRARVLVRVDRCRRLPTNRLPDLPALALARHAARVHGGALLSRRSATGCELRLELPGFR